MKFDRLVELAEKTHWLAPPFDASQASQFAFPDRHVCFVWDSGSGATPEQMAAFGSALVDSRCAHVVTAGDRCSEWHDAIDRSFMDRFPDQRDWDPNFLQTSWLDGKVLEDAVESFFAIGDIGNDADRHFVCVQIGDSGDERQRLIAAYRAQAPLWETS